MSEVPWQIGVGAMTFGVLLVTFSGFLGRGMASIMPSQRAADLFGIGTDARGRYGNLIFTGLVFVLIGAIALLDSFGVIS